VKGASLVLDCPKKQNQKMGRRILFIFLLFFCVNIFAEEKGRKEGVGKLQVIRVIPGDTLHGIARIYLKDPSRWPELLKYNTIPTKDPDLILPGMKLLVPVQYIKESMRAAKLVYKHNKVRYRRRGEAKWYDAILNMELYYEDALRTLIKSNCKVRFATNEILKIGENSLVILRPEELKQEVRLLKGRVLASKARVLTESSIIEPEKQGNTLFEAKIKEDRSTEVNVWKGAVDVNAKGEKMRLEQGFATKIELDSTPIKPWKLPEFSPQKIKEIENELTLPSTFNMKVPEVSSIGSFKPEQVNWEKMKKMIRSQKKGKVTDYKIQFAVERTFSDIIYEGNIKEARDRIKKFPDGIYYWRIAPVYKSGEVGSYSEIHSFTIDRRPPKINIISPRPNEKIKDEFIEVKGIVPEGLKVEVDGVEVIVDRNGNFRRIIFVPYGRHLIKIKVTDREGKEFYYTREVERIKEKKKGFFKKLFGG